MARIVSVATAYPEHSLPPDRVKAELAKILPASDILTMLLGMVDTTGVKSRRLFLPLEEVVRERPLEQQCREYSQGCRELGRAAAKDALDKARLTPKDVDYLITVSCTGFMIPSFDAYLMNDLGFRSDCRRLPITELGCAGGAAAVARAHDFLVARPNDTALIVAVELPGLTFQVKDLTLPALVSALLFGDGAAAAVVRQPRDREGAEILDTKSHLCPDSMRAMGFDLKTTGFHIALRKDVPELIRSKIGVLAKELLSPRGLSTEDISFFAMHPGGRKILEYMEAELGVSREALRSSWSVLAEVGNLSSASVLAVFEEELKRNPPRPGQHGLMAAFGPGFSAELLLLEWRGAE
jgi:alkylresorcinol/alkylpyrone synthase